MILIQYTVRLQLPPCMYYTAILVPPNPSTIGCLRAALANANPSIYLGRFECPKYILLIGTEPHRIHKRIPILMDKTECFSTISPPGR